MIAFYALVVLLIVFRLAGQAGIRNLSTFNNVCMPALSVVFVFTGITHFTELKHDYLAMIPPPFPRALWIVYVTGALELVGAIGLLAPSTRRAAGIGLALLLFAMFPANIYAAYHEIPFRGRPASSLWLRVPIQVLFVTLLLWIASQSGRPRELPPVH